MTAARIDMMTWPPFLPFRQPILARYPSRDFVVPFLISVVIHAFLVFLLRFVITDHTAFEHTAISTDTHLIVSLTTFDTAPQNELDREAASVVPETGPPVERKAEAESIVTPIVQEIPGSEIPDVKSLATDAFPSIDLEFIYPIDLELSGTLELESETDVSLLDLGIPDSEALDVKSPVTDAIPSIELEVIYPIDWEVGGTSELEFETVLPFTDLGIPGLEIPDGKYLANYAFPSIDPKAIHPIDWEGIWIHRIAQESTWMSESEILLQRYEYSMFIIKRNRALLPPDCRTAYASMGVLGISLLIRDAITGDGCKW